MVRVAPQHVANATLAGPFGGVGNALRQKRVVPQIGMRIERHRRKENHNRLMQCIRGFDRKSSAGLSSARCARCIQYTTQRPAGSGAPARRTVTRGVGESWFRSVICSGIDIVSGQP